MDGAEYRIKIPKRIDKIIQATVDEGLFGSKNDVVKAAVVKYLDDMHLLDQVKSSIETHLLEK
jgi:Arc/MetJ-type ribon-helix-helix transcriptional regulator